MLDEYVIFRLKSNKWEAAKKKKIKDTTNKEDGTALNEVTRRRKNTAMYISNSDGDSSSSDSDLSDKGHMKKY